MYINKSGSTQFYLLNLIGSLFHHQVLSLLYPCATIVFFSGISSIHQGILIEYLIVCIFQSILHHHAVHKISFISRDMTDTRAFGYVYGGGDGKHDFFGIKTDKAVSTYLLHFIYLIRAKQWLVPPSPTHKKKLAVCSNISNLNH